MQTVSKYRLTSANLLITPPSRTQRLAGPEQRVSAHKKEVNHAALIEVSDGVRHGGGGNADHRAARALRPVLRL
ncbi:hypothetical protein CBM2587_A160391 [Cupriavidus taiwanensis]|uniref:Uncharacterized protein n=1 Tax=Cupriavidus taiwanensis TaxID=164546 RepID=A0A975ZZ10_9BURK|nr:hypothetical protein CBM2587_A160391 [Cupriavidus taiwanensis]